MPSSPTPRWPRALSRPGELVADRVAAGFRSIISGDPNGTPDWVRSLADGDDEGYFGPGSAAWAVHGNLATLVGGVRALLVQALHPAPVAGVDQHSSYRQDPLGRLAGTTRWLTVTTFGARATVDREAARVRGMHRRVTGTYEAADGSEQAYRAGDERLLAWVHAAFTDSFLTAHQVFGGPIPGGADAYVAEWAQAAELVGVEDPPRSAAELRELMHSYDSELVRTEATERTLMFLRRPPLPAPARPGYAVLFAAASSTLDPRHRQLLGLPDPGRRVPRAAAATMLAGLRAVLGDGPPAAAAARRRVAEINPTA